MDLEAIGPHTLIEGFLNGGRLFGRAGDNDQPESSVTDKMAEFGSGPADLDVRITLASHVIGLAPKVNANEFKHWPVVGLIQAVREIQQLPRQPRAQPSQFCCGQSPVLVIAERRIGQSGVFGG
jgi:hypothetical protein